MKWLDVLFFALWLVATVLALWGVWNVASGFDLRNLSVLCDPQ